MNLQDSSVLHLQTFLKKLADKEPFSVIRPGDGEYFIMQNEKLHTQDKWDYQPGGSLQHDLLNVKNSIVDQKDLFVGIPCKGCHGENVVEWYKRTWGIKDDQLTYATIFCNKNWKAFTNYFTSTQHPFYYIGPGDQLSSKINIIEQFPVDSQLVDHWDKEKTRFVMKLTHWIGEKVKEGEVSTFLFSAGPITKIVIPLLHAMYPGNQFLDVGSSLDYYTKKTSNRFYMNEQDRCSQIICSFKNGHTMTDGKITVILNFYKRPHVLHEQLQAIREQTIKPKEIIIWKNFAEGYDFPEDIRQDPSIVIMECNRNRGVWARFAAGLLANTEYVCVFDDDTIPGRKWFENCLDTMRRVNGLLGTIGMIFNKNPTCYNSFGPRIGWDGPSFDIREVDMVCHSWFFRRAWLPELFKIVPDYNMMFRAGEDMGLSFAFQQIGIKTYVPAHPPGDFDNFGSLPDKARQYGTESVGISMSDPNFDDMFHHYKDRGFQFLLDRI